MTTRRVPFTFMVGGLQGWRRPGSRVEETRDLSFFSQMARDCEDAGFDALFVADTPYTDPAAVAVAPWSTVEPITLLAALAARTERIGLLATISSTFTDPYNAARITASLQKLSDGRLGVNVVTSFRGERNFGFDQIPTPAERYARAEEFIEVLTALWASWEPDALRLDRAAGMYADPTKVHRIDHRGQHFDVEGPLDVPFPEDRPLIVQAGASELGQDLAARYADLVYTAQPSLVGAAQFYESLKARVVAAGRPAESVAVLTGVQVILGETPAQAQEVADQIRGPLNLEVGVQQLGQQLGGVDLRGLPLDEPIPPALLPDVSTVTRRQGRFEIFRSFAVDEQLTVRELVRTHFNSGGHWMLVGTPEQVADKLTERLGHAGTPASTDGFNIAMPYLPEGYRLLFDALVPELRRRGLFEERLDRPLRERLTAAPVAAGL